MPRIIENFDIITIGNSEIRTKTIENVVWYAKMDIMKCIGYKSLRKGYVTSENKIQFDVGRGIKMNLVNKNGVRQILISAQRKCPNMALYEYFGVEINSPIICREAVIGTVLHTAFKDIDIIHQFTVNRNDTCYHIDYLPDYKVAIEIDGGHSFYDTDDEFDRQSYIEGKLGCRFLRCNPDDPAFDILEFIYKLRLLTKQIN